MSRAPSAGDIHAYVDNCLDREDRAAFEAQLGEDDELRQRVDRLRAQNEAIRAAFGAPAQLRGPFNFGRPANSDVPPQAPVYPGARRVLGEHRAGRLGLALFVYRALLFSACVALWLVVWPSGGPSDPRPALIEAGFAGYRAFAALEPAGLDVATADPDELLRGLGPRYRDFDLAERLPLRGLTLRGAKRVPGVAGGAALALFDDARGEHVGLLVEPMDAPPSRLPLETQRGEFYGVGFTTLGFGVAAIGADRLALEALATR